jgi:hypothetical protein
LPPLTMAAGLKTSFSSQPTVALCHGHEKLLTSISRGPRTGFVATCAPSYEPREHTYTHWYARIATTLTKGPRKNLLSSREGRTCFGACGATSTWARSQIGQQTGRTRCCREKTGFTSASTMSSICPSSAEISCSAVARALAFLRVSAASPSSQSCAPLGARIGAPTAHTSMHAARPNTGKFTVADGGSSHAAQSTPPLEARKAALVAPAPQSLT